jgi:hypothetical protein
VRPGPFSFTVCRSLILGTAALSFSSTATAGQHPSRDQACKANFGSTVCSDLCSALGFPSQGLLSASQWYFPPSSIVHSTVTQPIHSMPAMCGAPEPGHARCLLRVRGVQSSGLIFCSEQDSVSPPILCDRKTSSVTSFLASDRGSSEVCM